MRVWHFQSHGSAGLLLGVGEDVMVEYHISAFFSELGGR
jgi:hypothetical protein